MASTQPDRTLAERYTRATAHLTQEEAAELIGVNQRTMSNWRNDKLPANLRPAWRREILRVLESGVPAGAEGTNGEQPAVPEDWRDLTFVEVLLREAKAAEKRAEAAATWARWLEKEADASERVRAYAMREQKPTGAKPSPYRPAPGARGTEKEGEVGETGS